jgi:diguanylate cyclase (GGDEF)-like protein
MFKRKRATADTSRMDSARAKLRFRGFRALLAPRADPYAGVELDDLKRIGGPMAIAAGALGVALAFVAPPTEAIGYAGWFAAGGILGLALANAFVVLRPGSNVGFNGLLLSVYLGITQVAVVEWLAGGHAAPYHWLYLSAAVFPPSVHPPRRAAGIVLFASAACALPLLYQPWSGAMVADIALQIVFMCMLALAAMIVMDAVREYSQGLEDEGKRAHKLARMDALTGLGNRRAFDEALAKTVERASPERPLSLVVVDLDDFKAINDEQGHQRGDLVLKEVAAGLRSAVRAPDACFRWGGDEFAVLLPNTSPEHAHEVAVRIQAAVPTSVSCGVASLWDGEDADALLTAADDALRLEKAAAA